MGLKRVTTGFKGFQGVTRGYMGLQGVTEGAEPSVKNCFSVKVF